MSEKQDMKSRKALFENISKGKKLKKSKKKPKDGLSARTSMLGSIKKGGKKEFKLRTVDKSATERGVPTFARKAVRKKKAKANKYMDQKQATIFAEASSLNYKEQGIFFLNAMWKEHEKDAQQVYDWCKLFEELDFEKKKRGSHLNEVMAHHVFERMKKTMTALEMRAAFKEIDIDFDRLMSFLEFLLHELKADLKLLVSRPQPSSGKFDPVLAAAQKALNKVQKIIADTEALKNKLEKRIEEGKGIKAKMAQNELAQLLSKDNTPLNRALLTAEAAFRKAKKRGGSTDVAHGMLFWMEAELAEAKRYKPQRSRKKKK